MKINDGRLSASQAKKINSIVKKNFPDSDVSVSSSASSADSVCEQACNAAKAIAYAACEEEFSGIAEVVCKLAADAAHAGCLELCD